MPKGQRKLLSSKILQKSQIKKILDSFISSGVIKNYRGKQNTFSLPLFVLGMMFHFCKILTNFFLYLYEEYEHIPMLKVLLIPKRYQTL